MMVNFINVELKENSELKDIKSTNPIAVGDKVDFDLEKKEMKKQE